VQIKHQYTLKYTYKKLIYKVILDSFITFIQLPRRLHADCRYYFLCGDTFLRFFYLGYGTFCWIFTWWWEINNKGVAVIILDDTSLKCWIILYFILKGKIRWNYVINNICSCKHLSFDNVLIWRLCHCRETHRWENHPTARAVNFNSGGLYELNAFGSSPCLEERRYHRLYQRLDIHVG
jgi:hypothetical protein